MSFAQKSLAARRRAAGPATAAALAAVAATVGGMGLAFAQQDPPAPKPRPLARTAVAAWARSRFAVYGQATYTEQETNGFHAPYAGPNSLSPGAGHETTDATLYLGVRLWQGAELWVNPEADEGFGLDDTLGLAGFSSGEAYKVGRNAPYFRLQRAFIRQTINLGGEITAADAGPNQFALHQSADRLVVTAGKLSVVDIFDVNRYAHDARADFLNWSVIDAGTFDYAADAWGYSVGGAAEWYTGSWAWRAGVFDLSDVPNSAVLEPAFHEYQVDLEAEHRHELLGQPGKIDLTVFESRGRMGLLEDAIAYGEVNGVLPEVAPVRRYRKRDGVSLNLEQQLTADVGIFARLGDAGGNVETYEFTDIDRTASAGVSVGGGPWHRPGDTVGVAGVVNALSRERRQYLAAGGLGILVGDGKLPHAGHENILETYYELAALSALHVTLDYQWVGNPAYNRDRGPVSIFALRVHAEL
ncbi:MAG TPA: carbohydrate porin [Steroidobacteraceae bacterium]|nr:carbohydrate porin [Steroidobacteraceae bacterium]